MTSQLLTIEFFKISNSVYIHCDTPDLGLLYANY